MKKILLSLIVVHTLFGFSCSKTSPGSASNGNPPPTSIEKGIVKGRVTDSKGNPIPNVKLVIEHTIYYAGYIYATSDHNGYYRANLPNGSWQVSGQLEKEYLGRRYTFDLHPGNAMAFEGTNGAIRNFTWQLAGAKPAGGFYGSNVAVYPEPGAAFLMQDVALTLQPLGPLANGEIGQEITKKLIDIGGGEDGITDVPVGQYIITARNTVTGQPLQIRLRNTGTYASALTGVFTAGFTGSTTYQLVVQVK